ncbi:hypothetical protein [Yoonia sp.]
MNRRWKMMAANRRRDTKPEMLVRKYLHARGCRFATTPKAEMAF